MQPQDIDYLKLMGIDRWQLRYHDAELEVAVATNHHSQTKTEQAPILPVTQLDWPALEARVAQCQLCQLCQGRTQTVFGVGHQQADLLIVGEAPGFYEDKQGEPFVGRAGQLLTAILKSIGLAREQVYIANVLKCRPPNNRDPHAQEVELCTPYLQQQVALLKPKIIVAVGRYAAHYLLQTNQALSRLRGRLHHYGPAQVPLLVSYHPAYLLRNPVDKRKAYSDWLWVQELLQVTHAKA